MSYDRYILVIGAGSIGERYIRNLSTLGYRKLVVFRQRNLPFRDIGDAKPVVVLTWAEVETYNPWAAIICTPTAQHVSQAMECVKRGIHVLVEKPLSHNLEGISHLKSEAIKNKVLLQVGYMMRYYPLLLHVVQVNQQKEFGKLLYVHSYWGEYLPDWHPWEDYRASYAAQKELGGGVALTLSHDLDVCLWIVNSPVSTYSSVYNYASGLEVNVESGADFLLAFDNGTTAHVHLNYFQKEKCRQYHFVFQDAVIDIDFFSHTLTTTRGGNVETRQLHNFDRNELFLAELNDFFFNTLRHQNSPNNIDSAARIIELCTS